MYQCYFCKFIPVLDSYPSGAVLPIGGNVTEESESEKCRSKEPSTSSSSIQQEETADSVVENKKIGDSPRKKLKSFPKVPTHFRTRNETLTRLRIQNKILKKKLAKALKGKLTKMYQFLYVKMLKSCFKPI